MELICDLAEVYHVLDYRRLPAKTVAVLFFGLRDTSRVKQKLGGAKGDQKDLLLASIADSVRAVLVGLGGGKMPPSIASSILGDQEQKKNSEYNNLASFATAEEFQRLRYGKEETEWRAEQH